MFSTSQYDSNTNFDQLNREFFWKKNSTDKGLPLVAWDRIRRLKDRGGIGLRKIVAVNTTFQCKLAWKVLTNNESMWVQIMHNKYLQNQDFFRTKIKQGDSNVWRSIMKCKELIRQAMVWSVRDGNDISFWYDNWIENRCLRDLLNLEDETNLNPRTKVCEFFRINNGMSVNSLNTSAIIP